MRLIHLFIYMNKRRQHGICYLHLNRPPALRVVLTSKHTHIQYEGKFVHAIEY